MGDCWRKWGRDRIALAPDTAGFGDSDMPPEPPEIADHAAAMGEVLDALEIDEVDLMGYHTGSRIALELAQQRPRQVRRLILVSTSIYTDDELANQRAHYAGRDPDDDGDFLKAAWDGHKKWRSRDAPLIFVHREVAESLRGGANAWWGHRAAFNYLPAENLPVVKQPVLHSLPKGRSLRTDPARGGLHCQWPIDRASGMGRARHAGHAHARGGGDSARASGRTE